MGVQEYPWSRDGEDGPNPRATRDSSTPTDKVHTRRCGRRAPRDFSREAGYVCHAIWRPGCVGNLGSVVGFCLVPKLRKLTSLLVQARRPASSIKLRLHMHPPRMVLIPPAPDPGSPQSPILLKTLLLVSLSTWASMPID